MKIYGFFYNSCIHESAPGLMGLYMKEKDAEIAMEFHKEAARLEFVKMENHLKSNNKEWGITFGMHESWFVEKLIVIE